MGKVVELFGEAPEGEFPSEFCFSSPMLYEDNRGYTLRYLIVSIARGQKIVKDDRSLVFRSTDPWATHVCCTTPAGRHYIFRMVAQKKREGRFEWDWEELSPKGAERDFNLITYRVTVEEVASAAELEVADAA